VVGLVLVSHGALAQALLDTASEIVGPIEPALALTVARSQSLDDIEAKLREAVKSVDRGEGVLILADMFGGTASNVALQLVGADGADARLEVVTGFNLPMLLKLSRLLKTENDLNQLAQTLKAYGQKNIVIASEVMKERAR
jgi:PTS system mannose-specific IIA component